MVAAAGAVEVSGGGDVVDGAVEGDVDGERGVGAVVGGEFGGGEVELAALDRIECVSLEFIHTIFEAAERAGKFLVRFRRRGWLEVELTRRDFSHDGCVQMGRGPQKKVPVMK